MPLTPLDIRKKEFNSAMRGYNKEEVRSFMDSISSEMEKLKSDQNELITYVNKLQKKIEDSKGHEKGFQDSIIETRESSASAQADASKESEAFLEDVQKITLLKKEIVDLQGTKELMVGKIKQVLQLQLQLLDSLEYNVTPDSNHVDNVEET